MNNVVRPQRRHHETPANGLFSESDLKRFWARVDKSGGCWNWTAGKNEHGYGMFFFNRKKDRASRASWMLHNGTIPEGLWVLHECDNPACVNPDHLFLGTAKDNTQDMLKKNRHNNQFRFATHCPHGHKYGPQNPKTGHRMCTVCQLAHNRIYRAEHDAAGSCVTCGKERKPGKKLCPFHHQRMLERGRASYHRLRASGAGLIKRSAQLFPRRKGHGTETPGWEAI